ncbi:capsule-associated protein CAP1 [Serendipita sp. 398]|nr:capsule-associated protein CAP1 [Serendipita sp. 398]KAG8809116.1 capsule-associated protein CAP1 [Serendipita sp. 400]
MERPRLTKRREDLTLIEAIKANRNRLFVLFLVFLFIAGVAKVSPDSTSLANPLPYINKWIPDAAYFLGLRPRRTLIIHPIPKLMTEAQATYKNLLGRQSKTLSQATKEYRTRYGRDPPKGFNEWVSFVKANKVKMVDEYDQLIRDLEPFWQLSGEELRRRADQVGHLPSIDFVRLRQGKAVTLNIEKGSEDSEVSARAKGFRMMVEKFQEKLPDMDFPINSKAEGRVLVPWEHMSYPNMTEQDSSKGIEHMLGGQFVPDWKGNSSVWEAFRRTCPPSSQARRLFHSMRAPLKEGQRPVDLFEKAGLVSGPDEDFEFAPSVDDQYNFCRHPHAHMQQGHFFSDWRTIPVLYPVFSPAKTPGYSDILIPSHYYYSSTKKYTYGWDPVSMTVKDVDDGEIPWNNKTSKIFWRGATTGGGSSPPGYLASYQRHRFVRMTSDRGDGNRTVIFADPPGTDNFVFARLPISKLNEDFMDAAFTKAVACVQYPGGCDALRREHRFTEAVPLGEHWRHKYLVDFDGMGYSARLFAFLASDSAVIKSTVYREFFSDWIQPWLHFIPLSQTYHEIYNIHAYFSGPSAFMTKAIDRTANLPQKRSPKQLDGDEQLHQIARAGRQWKSTMGRKVDMEAYVYRLCLEWARLWSDDRDAMSFKG